EEGNKKQYAAVLKIRDELSQKAIKLQDYTGEKSFKDYQRLAGEIEAREVAIRKNLTKEQRRIMPPYAGEMIPKDQWIVTDGEGTSFSVEVEKNVLFSKVPDMYSALTRAAEAPKFPAKLPAKSVINQLKKATGVKQVEIDVSGIAEWLEGKDKVTKAEVVDFLRMNEVRIEEVEKGKEETITKDDIESINFSQKGRGSYIVKFKDEMLGEVEIVTDEIDYDSLYQEDDAIRMALERVNYDSPGKTKSKPKFENESYRLPGGEPGTYRELVLRIPGPLLPNAKILHDEKTGEYYVIDEKTGKEIGRSEYYTDLEKDILQKGGKAGYKSAHWDEPNVIAHIRGDIRIVNGKRVFHVAEFQSDIYSKIVELEAEKEQHAEALKKPISEEDDPRIYRGLQLRHEGIVKELANLKKLFPWGENWHELVAKKALEYAIKNDLEGISWDTAKTQVDRWESALRKSVDKIEWEKTQAIEGYATINASKGGGNVFKETIPLQGETTINGQEVTLNNLIGKELATKIRESSETSGNFEGKDLTLGGEFYKIIYDQKIPGFLKKYGKKWGAKVGISQMGRGRHRVDKTRAGKFRIVRDDGYVIKNSIGDQLLFDTKKKARIYARDHELKYIRNFKFETIHTMPIPDAMRQAIQTAGQPLFAEGKARGKSLTVDTAKVEIAKRIGQKAVDALERTKKVIFITKEEQTDIIGYARASKDQGFYKDGTVYLIPE
ncbi:MAG: hypothetical protein JRI49_08055, partial [Deltaproteobacteria bacterium]|nr:hypothetical protein [Deltaproteobacteria bacterium]